jgi:cephalosporin hydroxylase
MNYATRSKIARLVRFFRPEPSKIPVSVARILSDSLAKGVVDQFNRLYYESGVAGTLRWRGIELLKNPCDLWMMVELLQLTRPSVLIETGTHCGGSALYFAEMCKVLNISCSIITIDINPKFDYSPETYGIIPIVGYSTQKSVVGRAKRLVEQVLEKSAGPVMVTLDSDHSEENVSRELELYSPFVTLNSYLVVEDTNVNGHPSSPEHGPGPWEAVQKFLVSNPEFVPDITCERHLLTFFPRGWLKRVGAKERKHEN